MALGSLMLWGIEFEYLLVDTRPTEFGRVRDFASLDFQDLQSKLSDKPGRGDGRLTTGDQGIRSGYWYLEGDERAFPDGSFRTLAVKGVEIRTPPAPSVRAACSNLLDIEAQLSATLLRHQLALGIVGFNPTRARYEFDPPLNAWEEEQRRSNGERHSALVTTLSYGPDINLSHAGWGPREIVDRARKLNWYAPFIVPFSFSSPFRRGVPWGGWSFRTHQRAPLRPAVKVYCDAAAFEALSSESSLLSAARVSTEVGRIEFKAFDAFLSIDRLASCCHLLHGLCLDTTLPGRSETPDLELYRSASLYAFDHPLIRQGAQSALRAAEEALAQSGHDAALPSLRELEAAIVQRSTPAHELLETYRQTGQMFKLGGLGAREVTLHPGLAEISLDGVRHAS